jgi:hypothetical protein
VIFGKSLEYAEIFNACLIALNMSDKSKWGGIRSHVQGSLQLLLLGPWNRPQTVSTGPARLHLPQFSFHCPTQRPHPNLG